MTKLLLTLAFVLLILEPANAQNDIVGARTQQWTVNLEYGVEFQSTDSVLLMLLEPGVVITRLYWTRDSNLVALDSLQIRTAESQQVVHTYSQFPTEPSAISWYSPMHPVYAPDKLYMHRYIGAPPEGQIRLTIEWIQTQ